MVTDNPSLVEVGSPVGLPMLIMFGKRRYSRLRISAFLASIRLGDEAPSSISLRVLRPP